MSNYNNKGGSPVTAMLVLVVLIVFFIVYKDSITNVLAKLLYLINTFIFE